MKFLATDLFQERLVEAVRRHPAARGTVQTRLRQFDQNGVAGQSKKLEGSPGFWSSRINDDLRMLWQRGQYLGESVVYLYTIGGHDHVFEEARRVRPDGWRPVEVPPEPDVDQPWALVDDAPPPVGARCTKLDLDANPTELALTEEQELLADDAADEPLAVTGPAGSGKTTVLAHKATRMASRVSRPVLFVTFHETLASYTRDMLRQLHGGDWVAQVHVRSFRELVDETWALRHEGRRAPWIDPRTRQDRVNEAVQRHGLAGVPSAYLDAEIRGALLGRWLPGEAYPTLDEYTRGRRNDLTFLREADRVRLHAACKEIATSIRSAGLVDNLSAARELAQWIDQGEIADAESYLRDGLFIDECQDFTEVELEFLARLVPNPNRWSIAADELQVVHPSLFRWDRVRDAVTRARRRLDPQGYTQHPRVETRPITTNHRNPKPVLDLGLSVLQWRHALLGGDPPTPPASWAEGALVPRVATYNTGAFPADAIASIAKRVPLTAVLCPTASMAADVRAAVSARAEHFSRAFEFGDAKGLEFDVVILIDAFSGPDGDAFERRATKREADHTPDGVVELSMNRLYVAVTRSKRALFAVESKPPHATWEVLRRRPTGEAIPGVVETAPSVESLVEIVESEFALASKQRWRDAASQFERMEKWEAAIECWLLSGDAGEAGRVVEQALGQRERAASLYAAGGRDTDAARCRAELADEAGQWRAAATAWTLADNLDRSRLAEARALRAEGEGVKAAMLFEALGRVDDAVDTWLGLGIAEEAYRLASGDRPPEWRARLLARLGRHAEAATAWAETGRHDVNALDEALLSGDDGCIVTHLRPVLALKDGPRFVAERMDRLPGSARALAGRVLGDWLLEARGLYDSGRVADALSMAEGRLRGDASDAFRDAARLVWGFALEGAPGIDRARHARRSLDAELRFTTEGRASGSFLVEAEGWATSAGLGYPARTVIERVLAYREVCRGHGDRVALRAALDTDPRHPVLTGLRLALDGDVARGRELFREAGVPQLCLESLNPMLALEHYPALLTQYKRGYRLAADERERLAINLALCFKSAAGEQAGTIEGMRAELRGEPHNAWKILGRYNPSLAAVRHESPLARRQKMLHTLERAATLTPAEVRHGYAVAEAYAAADEESLSRVTADILLGDDLPGALSRLVDVDPHAVPPVSLPVQVAFLAAILAGPDDKSPLGPTWASLAERHLDLLGDGTPARANLLAVITHVRRTVATMGEVPELATLDDFRSDDRKVVGVKQLTDDLGLRCHGDAAVARWESVLAALSRAHGNSPAGRIAHLALRWVRGEKRPAKVLVENHGGAVAELVRRWEA